MTLRKIVLIPDSFKGTISQREFCDIGTGVIRRLLPECEIVSIPFADGGEGTCDSLLSIPGGRRMTASVKGPFFEEISSFFALVGGGKTAVIEIAASSGLTMTGDRKTPGQVTSYGTGQLISAALDAGAEKIILALGGSAGNDFGCGMAAALGVRFFDSSGAEFIPTGDTLHRVAGLDVSGRDPRLGKAQLLAMCDVNNPLYGKTGAAYVFAPQKGADPSEVEFLDEGLRHICAVTARCTGTDVSEMRGAGAAGGTGGGSAALLGFSLVPGTELMLDITGFDKAASDADLVITGEGKLDGQTAGGKAVSGIARRSKLLGVPCVAVAGGCDGDISSLYEEGLTAVFTTNRLPQDFSIARKNAKDNLAFALDNLIRFYKGVK